jgi:hypothetical protein
MSLLLLGITFLVSFLLMALIDWLTERERPDGRS